MDNSRLQPAGKDDNSEALAERSAPSREELSRTSTSLMQLAKALDEPGWARVVDTYSLMVYSRCRRNGLCPEDAKDVCQDVFAAVARKIGDFQHDRPDSGFRKWLRTITTNKLCDYWRAEKIHIAGVGGTAWLCRINELTDSMSQGDPTTRVRPHDDAASRPHAIARARAEVSARDWAIFERLVLENRLPAEVADELAVSRNTVYVIKSRILRRLRAYLASSGERS